MLNGGRYLARSRPLKLGLTLALAGVLGVAACQQDRPNALSGKTADLALATLKAAPEQGRRRALPR